MGMDCYAHSAIGFKVTENDFLVTEEGKVLKCRNGHPHPGGKAKFCQECGKRFRHPESVRATPALVALAESMGDKLAPDTDVESYWHEIRYERDGGLGVLPVGDMDYDNSGFLIVGEEVGNSGSHRFGMEVSSLDEGKIRSVLFRVRQVRETLGFEDRPIELHTWLYISV